MLKKGGNFIRNKGQVCTGSFLARRGSGLRCEWGGFFFEFLEASIKDLMYVVGCYGFNPLKYESLDPVSV